VNQNLTKKGKEERDFNDGHKYDDWPKHLPIDIDPLTLIQNMPGYDEGAYFVEQYDPMVDLPREWEEKEAE
jgi:hypothetical protein